jgi:PAS domain S-box-containing protein
MYRSETMADSRADEPFDFALLLDEAPDAVVVHDLGDQVLYWNRAAETLYGWSPEEIRERPVTRIFYLDAAGREEALGQLKDGGAWSGELRQIDRKGSEHLVFCRQRLLRDGAGIPVAVLSFNTDVTADKKRLDRQQRAHHVKSSNLLAGGIAHELNNALAPILLSSALLKRKIDDPKTRGLVSMIEKCANRGASLIADLLAFERGRGGGIEIVSRAQIERALRRMTEKKPPPSAVELKVEIAEDLWEIRGNSEDLEKVFADVVENAFEAMPEGGRLKIAASNRIFDENFESLAPEARAGAYIAIVFSDTGRGIERSLLDRVAEPFFTTKEPKKGHGFGLANALAVVKGHRGFMVLDSDAGRGMTLSLFLPSEVTPESVRNTAPPFPVSSEGAGKVVLVAEDEFFVRETLRKTLEDRGYNVATAADGTEALAAFASRLDEIDLVVTNIDMPYMDGLSLCRALRKLKPGVRILVSSGHRQEEKIEQIRAAGVRDFLAKPYTAGHLADTVQKMLGEA